MPPLKKRKAWKALATHFQKVQPLHLRDLFQQYPQRGGRLTTHGAGLYLDYSKNRVVQDTLPLLFQFADEAGLARKIDAMFNGEKINVTENRAVLHVALRAPRDAVILVDGQNGVPEVHERGAA